MKLTKSILQILLLFSLPFFAQAQEEELLPPEQAFSLTGWVDGDTVTVEYRIADGYYMYRDAFRFDMQSDGISFGELAVTGKTCPAP